MGMILGVGILGGVGAILGVGADLGVGRMRGVGAIPGVGRIRGVGTTEGPAWGPGDLVPSIGVNGPPRPRATVKAQTANGNRRSSRAPEKKAIKPSPALRR